MALNIPRSTMIEHCMVWIIYSVKDEELLKIEVLTYLDGDIFEAEKDICLALIYVATFKSEFDALFKLND